MLLTHSYYLLQVATAGVSYGLAVPANAPKVVAEVMRQIITKPSLYYALGLIAVGPGWAASAYNFITQAKDRG